MNTLEIPTRSLDATDRCDSCTAAARVIVTFLFGELMFCGHHAREKFSAFQPTAVTVYDPDNFLIQ